MEMSQFSELLVQNASFLKTAAHKFVRNLQDADDLQQETLCKALEHQNKFTTGINVQAWLYVIMRNTFINIYRRKKKTFQPTNTDGKNPNLANKLENSYCMDINYTTISSKINGLPNKLKAPFVLYIEGYKYAEIADLLGEPIGTIKSRIFFARRLLQETLERD